MKYFIIFALVLISSCAGTPDALSPDSAAAGAKFATGDAATRAVEASFVPAASYFGDSTATSSRVSRSTQSTGTGANQFAFNFAAVVDFVAALKEMKAEDSVLTDMVAELESLRSADPVDTDRIDEVRSAIIARTDALSESLKGAGGTLPSLQNLTVVNVNRSAIGANEQSLTDEEARALASGVPEIIQQSKR